MRRAPRALTFSRPPLRPPRRAVGRCPPCRPDLSPTSALAVPSGVRGRRHAVRVPPLPVRPRLASRRLSRPAGQPPRASRATPRRSLRFTLVREHDPPESFHDVALVTSGDDEGSGSVDVSPTRTATPPRSVSTAWHFLELGAGVPKLVRVGALRLRRAAREADASVAFWFDDPRRVFAIALDAFVRVHAAGCRVDVPTVDQSAEVRPGRPPRARRGVDRKATRQVASDEASSVRPIPGSRSETPSRAMREPRSRHLDGASCRLTRHPTTMVAAPQDVRPVTPRGETGDRRGRDASVEKEEGASTPPRHGARSSTRKVLGECYRRTETEARAERRPGPRRQRAETETARGKGRVTRRTETRAAPTRTFFFGFVMTGEDIFSAWDSTSTGPRSSFVPPTRARVSPPRPVASVALSR